MKKVTIYAEMTSEMVSGCKNLSVLAKRLADAFEDD